MSGNIKAGSLAVCTKCGWYESHAQHQSRIKSENEAIGIMISFAVTILLVSAHMLSWGAHAFSIPALKLGQWTGTLSTRGYDELAQSCIDLGKYACARTALIENFQSHRTPEPLAKLAILQVRLQETPAAMTTFASYFNNGGKNGDAALLYGQLLEQAGRDEEAMKMLEISIIGRGQQLPIAATGAIVRIMMKQGRYDEARERIAQFHSSAENAKGYLNTELAQVEAAVKLYGRGRKQAAR